jgi:hypothetical protein
MFWRAFTANRLQHPFDMSKISDLSPFRSFLYPHSAIPESIFNGVFDSSFEKPSLKEELRGEVAESVENRSIWRFRKRKRILRFWSSHSQKPPNTDNE